MSILVPSRDTLVFLEEKYIDSVDKNYTVASIRHRLMMQGVSIADKKEDSEICLEVRSGGIGTDSSKMFLGIPEVAVPGMVTLPELRFITKESQDAAAKIGIVAYHTKSGQILGEGGVSLAQSDRNNWYVLGVGPYQNGSLKKDIEESTRQTSYSPNVKIPKQVAFQPPILREPVESTTTPLRGFGLPVKRKSNSRARSENL